VPDTGKCSDKVDQASGKTKEWAGRATDDERLEAEGRTQYDVAEIKENLRQAGEKVRDAAVDTVYKVANGLAFGADGTLFVADTARGAVWRVTLGSRGELRSPPPAHSCWAICCASHTPTATGATTPATSAVRSARSFRSEPRSRAWTSHCGCRVCRFPFGSPAGAEGRGPPSRPPHGVRP
jgi:uncharacterized protein YjbJ (UPF0337 family)